MTAKKRRRAACRRIRGHIVAPNEYRIQNDVAGEKFISENFCSIPVTMTITSTISLISDMNAPQLKEGYNKQRRIWTQESSPSAITMARINDGSHCGFGTMRMPRKANETRPSVDDDDPTTLIAKEMSRLSIKEREQAYEDVHGVSAAVHETPELIDCSLLEMEEQLQSFRTKPAYDIATTIQEDYVKDRKLRMVFLRADRFDAHKAAKRFVGWLDWKLKLFGREKLCKAYIGLDDLDDDARFVVDAGLYQILPARDSRGRVVMVFAGQYRHRYFRNIQASLQMVFYMFWCCAEDEINQKSGLVFLIYNLGKELEGDARNPESPDSLNSTFEISSVAPYLPMRIEGLHCLTPDHGAGSGFLYLLQSLTQMLRVRLRVHVGSHIECEYALLSFGVPSSLLPFTAQEELKITTHKNWIQRRSIKDEAVRQFGTNSSLEPMTNVFSGIDLPTRNDVLMGQGKPIREHTGNQRLAEILQEFYEEYNQAKKNGGRVLVARKILHGIQTPSDRSSNIIFGGGGGRFLKRRNDNLKSGWWEEVTDEDVLVEKICNGLRNVRKQKCTG